MAAQRPCAREEEGGGRPGCRRISGRGLSAFVSQGNAAAPQPPWLNPNKPIQARVNSLLGAMTLPEKVGQMDQQLVDNLTERLRPPDAAARAGPS